MPPAPPRGSMSCQAMQSCIRPLTSPRSITCLPENFFSSSSMRPFSLIIFWYSASWGTGTNTSTAFLPSATSISLADVNCTSRSVCLRRSELTCSSYTAWWWHMRRRRRRRIVMRRRSGEEQSDVGAEAGAGSKALAIQHAGDTAWQSSTNAY